ncbi:MAG: CHAD domain-containing protein [Candidatus Bathyarchaeota archaeon]|nr:CHAD domain-containing protein [Candidatus Bathyarchaeota archaeon]
MAQALYRLDVISAEHDLVSFLASRFSLSERSTWEGSVKYLDTFDWRLYRKKRVLWFEEGRTEGVLCLEASSGESEFRIPLADCPGFVWDLPDGAIREDLSRIVERRRLLNVVEVQLLRHTLRLLDGREKTVATVDICSAIREGRALNPEQPPLSFLQVTPIKGYEEDFEKLLGALEDYPEGSRTDRSRFELLLECGDRTPGDYTSKLTIDLHPEMTTAESTRLIHRVLLSTLLANEDGTRHDLDSEFLHDFRVATRRTRAALSQIRGVFPKEAVRHFSKEFAWLGQVTGPTRDLDVYLLQMDDYEKSLPEDIRPDLGHLKDFLVEHQRIEQRKLVRALNQNRFKKLVKEWEEFLSAPRPESAAMRNADTPIIETSSARIWKVFRRIIKTGTRIEESTPAEALHRLRIECKKLRYLLEFFRSLYSGEEMKSLIKSLRGLQNNLGDFNDCQVQQEKLIEFARQMVDERNARPQTLMAMGRLVERLEKRQQAERGKFSERFAAFSSKGNRSRFRELFKKKGSRHE